MSSFEALAATGLNEIFLGQTAASRCEGFPKSRKPSHFEAARLPEKISGSKCLIVEDVEGTTIVQILCSRTRRYAVSPCRKP